MTAFALTEMVDRVFADRYRVEALIGGGPITAVYVAFDLVEERRVALKVFDSALAADEAFIARLFDVLDRAAGLDHPNLVDIYDWGVDDGAYVVSELCEGGSLATLLAHGGRADASQALVIALETARALNHGHEQGAIHRGLNPRNVLFSGDQRVRLSDYGLAPVLNELSIAQSSRALENVRYSSPEQARGRPVTEATDLYSLALIVDEAVTGRPPVVADTVVGTLMARAEAAHVPSPELEMLVPSIERCGRLDPSERPEAGELAIGLLASAETMPRPQRLPLVGLGTPLVADVNLLVSGGSVSAGSVASGETATATSESPQTSAGLLLAAGTEGDVEATDVIGGATSVDGADGDPASDADSAPAGERPDDPGSTLDLLEVAEPVFADAGPSETDHFDVPAPGGNTSMSAYAETDEDADDRLPWWPLVALGALIVAAIAAGVFVFGLGQADVAGTSPAVTGLTLEELSTVVDSDVQIQVLERRENGTVAGTIVAQSPAAGEDLDDDQQLAVTVSLGDEMVELPSDLVGLSLEQAAARLSLAGLSVGELTEENNEALAAGLVVGLDEPTTQKPTGQSVALRVSLGPTARIVPNDIIGIAIADATSLLAGLRLQAVEEPAYSPDIAAGTVIAAIPLPGETVPADSAITLVVSAGPEPVEMPDIVGLSLGEATDVIEELGLVFIDSEGTPGEDVIGSLPPIGATVDVGTEVTIILAEPSDEEDASEDG